MMKNKADAATLGSVIAVVFITCAGVIRQKWYILKKTQFLK